MRSLNRLKREGIIVPVAGHHRIVTKEIKCHRINGTHVGPPLLSVECWLTLLLTCSARGGYPVWTERCVAAIRMVNTKEERLTPLTGSSLAEVVCCNSAENVAAAARKERRCQWQHFSVVFDITRIKSAVAVDAVRLIFSHARKFAGQQLLMIIHAVPFLQSVNINVLPAPSDQSRQTSWSEIVLPVSGIITLATVCLATFFTHFLCVYSAVLAGHRESFEGGKL